VNCNPNSGLSLLANSDGLVSIQIPNFKKNPKYPDGQFRLNAVIQRFGAGIICQDFKAVILA
jgi:hypothetical protein